MLLSVHVQIRSYIGLVVEGIDILHGSTQGLGETPDRTKSEKRAKLFKGLPHNFQNTTQYM